jgi:hypothetical protein
MIDYTPPTETDGPLGACAIAKSLLLLGANVTLVTDECNEEVLLACAAATAAAARSGEGVSDADDEGGAPRGIMSLESFPPAADFGQLEQSRLTALGAAADLIIAIERTGPCSDGRYLTMRARDMTHLVAPLDLLLLPPEGQDDRCTNDADNAYDADDADDGTAQSGGGGTRVPRSIGIGERCSGACMAYAIWLMVHDGSRVGGVWRMAYGVWRMAHVVWKFQLTTFPSASA